MTEKEKAGRQALKEKEPKAPDKPFIPHSWEGRDGFIDRLTSSGLSWNTWLREHAAFVHSRYPGKAAFWAALTPEDYEVIGGAVVEDVAGDTADQDASTAVKAIGSARKSLTNSGSTPSKGEDGGEKRGAGEKTGRNRTQGGTGLPLDQRLDEFRDSALAKSAGKFTKADSRASANPPPGISDDGSDERVDDDDE
jgi:hypothetical protein